MRSFISLMLLGILVGCAPAKEDPDPADQPDPTCDDGQINGDETDVDCGGSCEADCLEAGLCNVAGDCVSDFCNPDSGLCAEPTCEDGFQNGDEHGVDCGAGCDDGCDDGADCDPADDCTSSFCTPDTHVCATPGCDDGYQNLAEIDVDCGGGCGLCEVDQHCNTNEDCDTDFCRPTDSTCQEPICGDGFTNQNETDEDCGGLCLNTCEEGEGCLIDDDCVSDFCQPDSFQCAPSICSDNALSVGETDVDCGGVCGASCLVDDDCLDAGDCVSDYCRTSDSTCQTPGCFDGDQNQDETGEDCGGLCVDTCANDVGCLVDDDCDSGFCNTDLHVCKTPFCGDGFKNGDELGVDCRGTDCAATLCPDTSSCVVNGDCTNDFCRPTDHTCRTPACGDGFQNLDETGDDCGGSCSPGHACPGGETCAIAGDCVSNSCNGSLQCQMKLTLKSSPDRGNPDHTWGHFLVNGGDSNLQNLTQEHLFDPGAAVTIEVREETFSTWPFNGWTTTTAPLPGGALDCTLSFNIDRDMTITGTFPLVGGGYKCPGHP